MLLGNIGAAKKPKSVYLLGKRWTDSYGNTYHRVSVYVNEDLVAVSPTTYGYDRQFEQTAIPYLKKAGVFPRALKPDTILWRFFKDRNVKFISKAKDVKRKKDL